MNWILIGVIVLLAQKENYASIYGMANPVPVKGPSQKLNPFIKYWDIAKFDRSTLEEANRHHRKQLHNRKKRDLNAHQYALPHTIRLNVTAYDREFRLILIQDPTSVFIPDVEIENTLGPVDYDISRVYTGSLEDDERSQVHAILTNDNLLDGTIATSLEQFYIEPSRRYSNNLPKAGIHSIVYKLSDVQMGKSAYTTLPIASNSKTHCASEKLRQNILLKDFNNKIASSAQNHRPTTAPPKRIKRWLPDELPDNHNPPLPLDLEAPYNEEIGPFNVNSDTRERQNIGNSFSSAQNGRNVFGTKRISNDGNTFHWRNNGNRNILVNEFNPNNDLNHRTHLSNRNILVNSFNNSNFKFTNLYNNNSKVDNGNNSSYPSHKTHVEIITKNGATKKPHIIVNNYSPDMILTSQNFNSHLSFNMRNDFSESNSARTSYDKKSTCMLYLQADHTFFQKMGSDEASIEAITRHVQRANAIYKNTDFNGDGKPDNITFMIKRIKVHNMNALKDPTYRFPGNYGVEKFLELFSEEDYDAFCLAYMFTYRDFEMGTLGLAWTGDLKNAGGVCEKNGHYRGSLKSLNTGIVTLLNYGKHVPPAVSHVTLAHEIGHNFGSPHDPEICTPGGEDGNYIMFARATSGDKKNNNKFSPCSLKSIEPVLNAKARSAKGCFTEPQQSICGNGVVESGEQCDCGWEEDCKDSCCFPMSRHPRLGERPCTLTSRAMCSPSQGPCCRPDCSLKFGDKCRDDNGCRDPSFCDGRMPQCPPSVNKPNKTICNKEFVCYMGECTGSICLAYGLESCQCLPGPNDPKTKSCELCCKQPGEGNPCKSSFEWNEPPYDVPDMFAKPGTPCNDYNGYCDVFQKCREVDPSGPLATLRKLLLSEESIASFKKWLQNNWFTVILAIAGLIILLILTIKLLGRRTNAKLKSVTIIHSATTETVRLPEDNNGVIVHTAVRTKVPFKKKVRGHRNKVKSSTKSDGTNVKATNPVQTSTSKKIVRKAISKGHQKITILTEKSNITRKKSRELGPLANDGQQKKLVESKKSRKNQKNKEVIDYSSNPRNHTNTFGKVQKWLLESPIVSQPLSHIEHSSKVKTVISKSQSTPDRLGSKSPQKTKSAGNLNNEKVKLQVVYKPPFKFSLKLSKNSAVKTHVIGSSFKRSKRKLRHGDKKRVGVSPSGNLTNKVNDRITRTALLVRTIEDDTQKLSVNNLDRNYETLNSVNGENTFYDNIKNGSSNSLNLLTPNNNEDRNGSNSKATALKITRSISNSNLEQQNSQTEVPHTKNNRNKSDRNKINNSNVASARKISDGIANSGSTQNCLLSQSKKRNSLNLKSSKDNDILHSIKYTKRSSSNQNLKKDSSSLSSKQIDEVLSGGMARNLSDFKSSIPNRSSISNIPRASLNNIAANFTRQSSLNNAQRAVEISSSGNVKKISPNSSVSNSNLARPHTAACDDIKQFEWPKSMSNFEQNRNKGEESAPVKDSIKTELESKNS